MMFVLLNVSLETSDMRIAQVVICLVNVVARQRALAWFECARKLISDATLFTSGDVFHYTLFRANYVASRLSTAWCCC